MKANSSQGQGRAGLPPLIAAKVWPHAMTVQASVGALRLRDSGCWTTAPLPARAAACC